MFTRFRATGSGRQVSLAETRRIDERVGQTHVAGLGSIDVPPSVADCIAFWTKPDQRLAGLANRLDANQIGAILGVVHARMLIPTPDDQLAAHLENARADVKFKSDLSEAHAADLAGRKAMAADWTRDRRK